MKRVMDYQGPQTQPEVKPVLPAAYRDGADVVVPSGGTVPGLCVICGGGPTGEPVRVDLSWHPRWMYGLILFRVLPYLFAALFLHKVAHLYVPLCRRHRRRRRVILGVAGIVFVTCIFAIYFAITAQIDVLIIGVFGLWVLSLLVLIAYPAPVRVRRIEKGHVWLKGLERCLADLPEWPGHDRA